MMENQNELPVLHIRSSRAVISAGYTLYTANFRKLVHASWPMAVFYAIAMGLFSSFYVTEMPRIVVQLMAGNSLQGNMTPMLTGDIAIALLLALLQILATVLLFSVGVASLREHLATNVIQQPAHWYGHFDRKALWHTLKGMLWVGLAVLVIEGLASAVSYCAIGYLGRIATIVGFILIMLLALAIQLPLSYVLPKYLLTEKGHFANICAKGYPVAIRRLGAVFIVTLVVVIITMLLTLIVQLPANILYMANLQSQMGALYGDPLGMPEYIGRLNFAVFVLMGFLQAFIHLSTLFPLYYLYGSIEQQEQERNEMKQQEPANRSI